MCYNKSQSKKSNREQKEPKNLTTLYNMLTLPHTRKAKKKTIGFSYIKCIGSWEYCFRVKKNKNQKFVIGKRMGYRYLCKQYHGLAFITFVYLLTMLIRLFKHYLFYQKNIYVNMKL